MLPVLGLLFLLNLSAFVYHLPSRFDGQVETVSHPTICTDDSRTVAHIVHVLPHARNNDELRASLLLFRPCDSGERQVRIHVNNAASNRKTPAVGDAVVNSNVVVRRVR